MDFYNALQASGLMPRDVAADGRWHRCPTVDKPRKKNGAFMLRPCGTKGWFKNYATDLDWNVWETDRPISPAQRLQNEARERAIRERDQQRQIAAVRAMRNYFKELPAPNELHPYIGNKLLSARGCAGVRVDGDVLVIPAYSHGWLMSLQTITPDGQKKYRYGCPMKGASFEIGNDKAPITCLVEGFATGLAVHQSIPNARVIVCFDAGNMPEVAKRTNVCGLAVVCADNDWETEQSKGVNTGIKRAQEAAQAIGCGIAYPQGISGSDWADALREWATVHPYTGMTQPAYGRVKSEVMRKVQAVYA